MTVLELYNGDVNASGAIVTAIGTVSAANLIVIPNASGIGVAIYEVHH